MARDGLETREKLEQAAIRLFVRNGVAQTTMRDIAGEAKVSLGGMYNHYASKEDLAWELFSRSWIEIGRGLRQHGRQNKNLRDRLRAMTRYVFELYNENPDLVSYVFFSRHLHLRRIKPSLNPHMAFRMVIVAAIGQGEIPRQDVEVATAMTTGVLIQLMDTWALGRIRQDLAQVSEFVADRCYRLLGG